MSLPHNLILFTIRLHRILLLLLCARFLSAAIGGAIFAVRVGGDMGRPGNHYGPESVVIFTTALYLLGAFVLNCPRFPILLHKRLIYRVQWLLLPLVLFLSSPSIFLGYIVAAVVFFGFWLLNVRDRLKYEEAEQDAAHQRLSARDV
jgi:hypothetical protein